MLRLLKYNLEKTDCRVLAASSGEEVLDVLKDNEVDLLIIDVMMPDLDGFETVRRMKDLDSCKDIPVIILTGRGQSNTKEEAEALGISHFLTKPFSHGGKLFELTAKEKTASVMWLSSLPYKQ